jgi:hypothetical protein
MSKIMMLGLVMGASSAGATGQLVEIFRGKPDIIASRCAEGAKDAARTLPSFSGMTSQQVADSVRSYMEYSKSLSKDRTFTLTAPEVKPSVRIQTQYGSAFNVCRSDAKALKPQTDVTTLPLAMLVYVDATVTELKAVRDWNVALTFEDSKGVEIARFFPTNKRAGDLDDWDLSCKQTPCRYTGKNTYYFSNNAELAAIAEKAAKAYVLTSLGSNGIAKLEVVLPTSQL